MRTVPAVKGGQEMNFFRILKKIHHHEKIDSDTGRLRMQHPRRHGPTRHQHEELRFRAHPARIARLRRRQHRLQGLRPRSQTGLHHRLLGELLHREPHGERRRRNLDLQDRYASARNLPVRLRYRRHGGARPRQLQPDQGHVQLPLEPDHQGTRIRALLLPVLQPARRP